MEGSGYTTENQEEATGSLEELMAGLQLEGQEEQNPEGVSAEDWAAHCAWVEFFNSKMSKKYWAFNALSETQPSIITGSSASVNMHEFLSLIEEAEVELSASDYETFCAWLVHARASHRRNPPRQD